MNARELSLYRKHGAEALAAEADRQLAARRSRSSRLAPKRAEGRERKATKRKTKAERRREVYAAVDERSCGRCEFLYMGTESGPPFGDEPGIEGYRCLGDATEHDHFHGRAREESVESVWHLCPNCHRAKTRNEPARSYWLECFQKHARAHGYAAQVAKVEAALALEAAQHPLPASRRDAGEP